MADPFSTASAALGAADVLLRFSSWLRKTFIAAGEVDAEVQDLMRDVERLVPVYSSLKALQDKSKSYPTSGSPGHVLGKSTECFYHIESLWSAAGETINKCTDTVDKLERMLKSIVGESGEAVQKLETIKKDEKAASTNKIVKTRETHPMLVKVTQRFSGLRKELKRQSKEPHYSELRRDLQNYHSALNTSLIALQM
jgi:hypothetical protein